METLENPTSVNLLPPPDPPDHHPLSQQEDKETLENPTSVNLLPPSETPHPHLTHPRPVRGCFNICVKAESLKDTNLSLRAKAAMTRPKAPETEGVGKW